MFHWGNDCTTASKESLLLGNNVSVSHVTSHFLLMIRKGGETNVKKQNAQIAFCSHKKLIRAVSDRGSRGWINNFLKGTRPSDSGRTFSVLRGVPVKLNQTFWPGVYCWAGAMCMFCWAALLSLNLSAVIVSLSDCFCWTGTIQWHNHREIQTWVYYMWARITGGQQVVSKSVYFRYKLKRLEGA